MVVCTRVLLQIHVQESHATSEALVRVSPPDSLVFHEHVFMIICTRALLQIHVQESHATSEALIRVSPLDSLVFHEHLLACRPGMKKPGRKPKAETLAKAARVGVSMVCVYVCARAEQKKFGREEQQRDAG